MLVCALALSVAAHFFAVFPLDLKITHELQEEKNTVFAFAMKGVSAIGDTWPGIVMVGAAFAFYIVRRQLLEAVFILVTLSNFVLTSLLKVLVTRPRPSFFLLNPADAFQSINQYIFRAGMSSFLLSSLVSSRILHGFTRTGVSGYWSLQSVVPLFCSSVPHVCISGHTGQVMLWEST